MTKHNRVLEEIKKLAKQLFANIPVSAYLFGSRARGEFNSNSDWDILIVADDSLDNMQSYERYAYPFTEIGWRLGAQITPLLYTRSQWEAEKDTAFYINVNNDAIAL